MVNLEMLNIVIGACNIFCGILIIALSIPLLKEKIKMNNWYGFRISKSMESEENWYRLNKYAAQRMIKWSRVLIMIGALSFFVSFSEKGNENLVLIILFASAPIIAVIPCIEAYYYSKKL